MISRIPVAMFTTACTAIISIVWAQGEVDPESLLSKTTHAVRVDSPPTIDGLLDDSVWEKAIPVTDLIQTEPDNLAKPTEFTEVRIVYDDDALYFAFRCHDSEPKKIMRRLARRDEWLEAGNDNSDWIGIGVDPQNDDITGYVFIVNAAGVKMDLFMPDDENYDPSWNAVWDAKVSSNENGWAAEMAVPFSVFQFNSQGEQIWGLELNRSIYRKQERHEWPGKPRGVKGIVSRYGLLTGLENIPPPRQLEILPYILGGKQLGSVTENTGSLGVDMEYGLSTNSAASIAINPDFGQVEADPSILNLTAFETFYPEKRPFFVEGGSFFTPQFGEEIESWLEGSFTLAPIRLFHSRRIGRAPSYFSPSDGTVVSSPDATTILGATKVLGKTTSGISYGFIESLTNEEYGTLEINDGENVKRENFLIEPKTNYFIGRVEAPVINSTSVIGATVTDVRRAKASGSSVASVDWRLKFGESRFNFSGQAAVSQSEDKKDFASRLYLAYDNFKWWSADLIATYYGDSFMNNDLGFLERNGVWAIRAGGGVRKQDPWGPFRSNNFSMRFFQYARTDGIVLSRRVEWNLMNMFKSFWMFGMGGMFLFSTTDDGDLFKDPNAWMIGISPRMRFFVFMSTDPRNRIVLNPSVGVGKAENGSFGIVPTLNVILNPTNFLRISLETRYWKEINNEQYVTVLEDENAYHRIYSPFDQEMVDTKVRINWTFSPDLSFQVFVQPFVVKGDYYGFKELTKESTLNFSPYPQYSYNPDFQLRNTVGTFVIRWEYSLGSTLYLVYNLNDSNAYSGEADAWFSNKSNSLFLKLNYWFQP